MVVLFLKESYMPIVFFRRTNSGFFRLVFPNLLSFCPHEHFAGTFILKKKDTTSYLFRLGQNLKFSNVFFNTDYLFREILGGNLIFEQNMYFY